MPLLFSYGTLQRQDMQLRTFGRLLQGERDALAGYRHTRVLIADTAVASSLGRTHHDNATHTGDVADQVSGTVYEVTEAELLRVDSYERPFAYRRVLAPLTSGRQAWAYAHEEVGSGIES